MVVFLLELCPSFLLIDLVQKASSFLIGTEIYFRPMRGNKAACFAQPETASAEELWNKGCLRRAHLFVVSGNTLMRAQLVQALVLHGPDYLCICLYGPDYLCICGLFSVNVHFADMLGEY